ncbi:MAG TPA: GrpB family protein, partial [Puia sp.]|nr:GrpB family protein [Puia sp.]
KPVIDIDIIVEKPERLRDVILQLEGLGYIHAGDLGIEGREAFSRTSSEVPVSHPRREWPPHHLYVCRQGIESLQNHLLLRDYLRNHPEKAREYSALKEELLKRVNDDIDLYVEGKSEFIATVLEKAGLPAASITRMRGQNKAPVPDGERIQIVRNQSA